MRKITRLKFILLFALAGMVFSQENRGVITGKIFDAASQKPIEYANVILFSQNDSAMVTGTTSGPTGGFHLDKIPPGAYYIDIQFIGYKKKNCAISKSGRRSARSIWAKFCCGKRR